jgi:hypothetical protein
MASPEETSSEERDPVAADAPEFQDPAALRSRLEQPDLDGALKRIEWLLEQAEAPTSLALGIKLALVMAQEMRAGEPLGTRSGPLVAGWAQDWPRTTEEAVAHARQFLLTPSKLVEAIGSRLFESGVGNGVDSDSDYGTDSGPDASGSNG